MDSLDGFGQALHLPYSIFSLPFVAMCQVFCYQKRLEGRVDEVEILISFHRPSFRYQAFSQEWLGTSEHFQPIHYVLCSYGRHLNRNGRPLSK